MNPKKALMVVTALVLTGESIAEFLAQNGSKFIAMAIVIFAVLIIHSILTSQSHKR